jgi:hypothetical protein
MKEYFIRLKNLTTGTELAFRKFLTPDQVKRSIVGRTDRNNIQLTEFWEIK